MRLIDADTLQNEYKQRHEGKRLLLIDVAPTIEPERKKGKWIHVDRKKAYDRFCSECHEKCWYVGIGDYAFCPNCGADMREGEANG